MRSLKHIKLFENFQEGNNIPSFDEIEWDYNDIEVGDIVDGPYGAEGTMFGEGPDGKRYSVSVALTNAGGGDWEVADVYNDAGNPIQLEDTDETTDSLKTLWSILKDHNWTYFLSEPSSSTYKKGWESIKNINDVLLRLSPQDLEKAKKMWNSMAPEHPMKGGKIEFPDLDKVKATRAKWGRNI
jgi:hypothetical protein